MATAPSETALDTCAPGTPVLAMSGATARPWPTLLQALLFPVCEVALQRLATSPELTNADHLRAGTPPLDKLSGLDRLTVRPSRHLWFQYR